MAWETIAAEVGRLLGFRLQATTHGAVLSHTDHDGAFAWTVRRDWQRYVVELRADELRHLALRPGRSDPPLLTGEPAFDAALRVEGDPVVARVRLDADTRREALEALVPSGVCSGRALTWTWSAEPAIPAVLVRVGLLRALAVRLVARRAVEAELLARATRDPFPGVRSRTTRLLLDRPDLVPGSSLALLDAPDRALRRRAALAVAALYRQEASEALVGLLDDPDLDVVRALGEVGSPAAIGALRPLARSALGLSGLARAAQEAIRRIESRAPDASGAVSLSGPGDAGAVSVAAPERAGGLDDPG